MAKKNIFREYEKVCKGNKAVSREKLIRHQLDQLLIKF